MKKKFDSRELRRYKQKIQDLRQDAPEIVEELVVGEGMYAVKQARSIAKNEHIINTGQYRQGFHTGDHALGADTGKLHDGSRPKRSGRIWKIDVYNNQDHSGHLEHGFRSHFVPGHWEGETFVYQRDDPQGGMYVGPPGGYVRGHYTLRRAIRRTKDTQTARLGRKWRAKTNKYLKGDGEK